jgi:hypothetical protein
MERSSALSTAEIVGMAAASAAALGGIIVALGRSQAAVTEARHEQDRLIAIEPASRLTRENIERGRDLARQAAATVSANYPELKQTASELLQRATDTARPRASLVGDQASATADQLKATGATVLERLQSEVLPAASTAIAGFVERAEEAREKSGPAVTDVKSVAAAKADVALTKSTSAAKDSLATIAWLTAAASLIYFVLMSPERREQVKNALWGAIDQGLVLVRDFQGHDDEF